jgi:hypothetical protein
VVEDGVEVVEDVFPSDAVVEVVLAELVDGRVFELCEGQALFQNNVLRGSGEL